jgi:Bacterial SH3 domain
MKKFPGVDTLIMFVTLIVITLWGVKTCNTKKKEMGSVGVTPDVIDSRVDTVHTSESPASVRPVKKPAIGIPTPQSTITEAPVMPSAVPTTTSRPPNTPVHIEQAAPPPVVGQQGVYAAPGGQGSVLFVLIGGLNVRNTPDLKAKSKGRLALYDEVIYLNEVTDFTTPVHLITGEIIDKPWFKIKTKRGTIGWVHGSGVDFFKHKANRAM